MTHRHPIFMLNTPTKGRIMSTAKYLFIALGHASDIRFVLIDNETPDTSEPVADSVVIDWNRSLLEIKICDIPWLIRTWPACDL